MTIGEAANTTANGSRSSIIRAYQSVGSLSYTATPDPLFRSGFAGIQSTLAFNRVEVTFNTVSAIAFALDNVRRGPAVPEPAALTLLGTGLLGILTRVRRKTPMKAVFADVSAAVLVGGRAIYTFTETGRDADAAVLVVISASIAFIALWESNRLTSRAGARP